jgi:hypothetical protein
MVPELRRNFVTGYPIVSATTGLIRLDRVDDAMEEIAQMSMQCESLSTGGVLSYVGGPEGSQGAVDDTFLHGVGRPPSEKSRVDNRKEGER